MGECSFFLLLYLRVDLIKQLLYNTGMDRFHALADPTRRKIMEILARSGQLPASDIYEQFEMTPQAVSQHLKVLREAKLVRVEKQAQQRIYRINPEAMLELEEWARQLRQLWNDRFDAFEKVLEEEKRKASS
jgi:DNA-binding transcriptional ArsR family regulator